MKRRIIAVVLCTQVCFSQTTKHRVKPKWPPKATPVTVAAPPIDPIITSVRMMYKTKNYDGMIAVLQDSLGRNPENSKYRLLLSLAALRTNNRTLAVSQLDILSRGTAEDSQSYAKQLTADVASFDAELAQRTAFVSAVRAHQTSSAIKIAKSLAISEVQANIIQMYLEIFQAHYGVARKLLEQAKLLSTSEERLDETAVSKQIDSLEVQHSLIVKTIEDKFLYSPATISFCAGTFRDSSPDVFKVSVPEYIALVQQLSAIAPLEDSVLDLMFHAELLLGRYPELEKLGDSIIQAKGNIHIPSYSKEQYFFLVIDGENKKLQTMVDKHAFIVEYLPGSGKPKNAPLNRWNASLVPFDIQYSAITKIEQKAGQRPATDRMLREGAYVLKLNDSGVAPAYALMHVVACTQGLVASKVATHNLGKYVLHQIGNQSVKASLQDEKKFPSAFKYMDIAAIASQNLPGASSPLSGLVTNLATNDLAMKLQMEASSARSAAVISSIENLKLSSPIVASHLQGMIDSLPIQ